MTLAQRLLVDLYETLCYNSRGCQMQNVECSLGFAPHRPQMLSKPEQPRLARTAKSALGGPYTHRAAQAHAAGLGST
jgi:hypothetical protein